MRNGVFLHISYGVGRFVAALRQFWYDVFIRIVSRGGKIMKGNWRRAVVPLLVCAMVGSVVGIAVWRQGRSVADLMGISGREEIRDIAILKMETGTLDSVTFYRNDPTLAKELAGELENLECRYHHSALNANGTVITYNGQSRYELWFFGAENGEAWEAEEISVFGDGRIFRDGKCYYLKKEYPADSIAGRLEGIMQEFPESIVN